MKTEKVKAFKPGSVVRNTEVEALRWCGGTENYPDDGDYGIVLYSNERTTVADWFTKDKWLYRRSDYTEYLALVEEVAKFDKEHIPVGRICVHYMDVFKIEDVKRYIEYIGRTQSGEEKY